MPHFDRLLPRLQGAVVALGDWLSDAMFFVRYHLWSEIRVRVSSLIPDLLTFARRVAASETAAKTAAAASDTSSAVSNASASVASSAAAAYKRVVAATPEPVKTGYRAAVKTEGRTAAALRTTVAFLVLLLSIVALVVGVFTGAIWLDIVSAIVCILSVFAIFTQDEDDTLVSESTTVETIINVSVLGNGRDSIVSIRTVSLGGEVRDYSIMRDDLDIIDSREPRADVTRVVMRRVSRNAYGWVMAVREIEYVTIAAYTPLREKEHVDP